MAPLSTPKLLGVPTVPWLFSPNFICHCPFQGMPPHSAFWPLEQPPFGSNEDKTTCDVRHQVGTHRGQSGAVQGDSGAPRTGRHKV